ncbi:GNAT family N-acetyltransferase [Desulfocurvus sp. DL9XJH121]
MPGPQRLQTQGLGYEPRRGGPGDLDVLFRCRARMFATFCDTDPVVLARADHAFWGPALAREEAAFWLAEDGDGAAVACCAATLQRLPPKPFALAGVQAYVSSMWTEPEHRRRGLAGMLLRRAVEFAASRGAALVSLHASEAGRGLYAAHGFAGTNEMRLPLTARA